MATSGDLQLALLIKANAQQARAELAATQAQLKGVEASAREAGSGFGAYNASLNDITAAQRTAAAAAGETTDALAATSQAFATTAAATAATGETAEQAAARIHAMVQASLAAGEASRVRINSESELMTASEKAALAAEAGTKSWRDLAAAQTAQMNRYTAMRAPYESVLKTLEQSTITTAEFDAASLALAKAVGTGAITAGEYREALDLLDKAKIKDVAVTKAQTKANAEGFAASLNYRSRREVGTIGAEALSGNFGRVRTSGLALANDMGLFTKLLSPVGLAVTGVVAALGTLAVAFAKGEAETTAYNKALILTGNYSGQTVGQLQVLAQETAKITDTTQHAAAAAVAAVVQSGKFYGDTVGLVAQAAVAMQQTTGQAVDRTIAEFAKLADDPVKASVELNNATHYLTQSIYDQITALVERGEKDEAAKVAQDAYAQAQIKRANDVKENLGALETVWKSITSAAKDAWDAMLDIGREQTPESKIAQLRSALADQQKLLANAGKVSTGGSGLAGGADLGGLNVTIPTDVIKANIARIQQQIKTALVQEGFATTDSRTAALKQRLTDQAIDAQNALASGAGTSDLQKLRTRLNDLAVEKTKALYGVVDPDARQKIIDSFNLQVADAARQYDAAEKKLNPKGAKGPNLDALQTNANVAAIQQSLSTLANAWQNTQKTLDAQHRAGQLSDQQYFDALRKDLDQYTQQRIAALEQEKTAATAHVKTAADRIRSDQQVAKIDAEITQTRQDAAAKHIEIAAKEQQSIEKSRQEWEQLRRSFETPAEVRAEDAIAQIQKLNKALANGVITARQYHDALQQIGQKAVANALPTYRGVSGAVGGPYGELQKNFQAEHALIAAYEAQKLALKKKFNDQDSAQEQAHQAALAALDAQYAEKRNIIEQSRQQLYLTGAETFFNQLAQLSSSKNKTLATIGKAASIASTLVKAYQSGTEARAALSGIPYIGPALGIAAEAAAIAAGLANVAQMRAQNVTSGYLGGGYTGNAPITQAVGVVHGREGVLSAPEIDAIGGEAGFNTLRGMIRRGYATGGYVSPFANAPSPSDLGFTAPASPRMDFAKLAAANDSAAAARAPNVKVVAVWDRDQAAHEVLNTPTGHKVIVQTVGDNPRTIQGKWQAG